MVSRKRASNSLGMLHAPRARLRLAQQHCRSWQVRVPGWECPSFAAAPPLLLTQRRSRHQAALDVDHEAVAHIVHLQAVLFERQAAGSWGRWVGHWHEKRR